MSTEWKDYDPWLLHLIPNVSHLGHGKISNMILGLSTVVEEQYFR
jgi:hypothetical protein